MALNEPLSVCNELEPGLFKDKGWLVCASLPFSSDKLQIFMWSQKKAFFLVTFQTEFVIFLQVICKFSQFYQLTLSAAL